MKKLNKIDIIILIIVVMMITLGITNSDMSRSKAYSIVEPAIENGIVKVTKAGSMFIVTKKDLNRIPSLEEAINVVMKNDTSIHVIKIIEQ